MLAVFRRELKAYFTSPIGFVFMGFFLLLAGILFALGNLFGQNPQYADVVGGSYTFIFLLVVPILTMRLVSEEMRQKTDQLLMTSPLTVSGIVLGKYFAAVAVFFLTTVITLIYPLILNFFALGGLAWAQITGTYVGFFLLGACFIALGLFFSSLTDNQLIAAVVTFAALLFIWLLDWVTQNVPSDAISGLVFLAIMAGGLVLLVFFSTRSVAVTAAAGVVAAVALILLFVFAKSFYEGLILNILNWVSLLKRYSDMRQGILSLSPIVYYLSFAGAFVYFTMRMIEKRRWA